MNELGQQPRVETGLRGRIPQVVCLVDDDPSVRRSVGRLLESDGFKVLAFSRPQLFLDFVANNPVQVAVLDIWMDQMTGMELLAHLSARSPKTKNIFITGHEDPAARATVMTAGAFAFFLKPFDDAKFLEAVRSAFAALSLCDPV
jgi:FixJ family two-component response regulator